MNTQKRVNERINNIALKNQKVDLSTIDNLEKKTQEAIDSFNNVNASARKAGQIIDKAEGDAKKLGKLFQDLEGEWAKIQKTAKDLGFDLPSKSVSLLRDASAYRSIAQNAAGELQKASGIVYGLDD